jgi:hypothetical protein
MGEPQVGQSYYCLADSCLEWFAVASHCHQNHSTAVEPQAVQKNAPVKQTAFYLAAVRPPFGFGLNRLLKTHCRPALRLVKQTPVVFVDWPVP